jgi:hypothetical protein
VKGCSSFTTKRRKTPSGRHASAFFTPEPHKTAEKSFKVLGWHVERFSAPVTGTDFAKPGATNSNEWHENCNARARARVQLEI